MKSIFLTIILLFLYFVCTGQNKDTTITSKLISTTFTTNYNHQHTKRKVLSLKNKKLIFKLNPLLYVGAGLMYFYQNVLSEQIQADCTYQISCSEFTKKSIEQKGFIKGTLEGCNQLFNCIPGAVYERSDYLINADWKINNVLDGQN